MNSSTRLALLLGLQLAAGAAFIACGSDAGGDEKPGTGGGNDAGTGTPSSNGGLSFLATPLYSAYVPGHEAQVPIVIKDGASRGKGAKFTSNHPEIAVVSDTTEGALVTVKKEGKVIITGVLGEDSGNVSLTIKAYTEDQWKTGQARYSKSELAIMPKDGAAVSAIALVDMTARNPNGACNTCHTQQAQTLKIENGPTQIAGYSDDDLITIFTKGTKPEGASVKTMIPPFIWGMIHAWTVTEEEKTGLIAYLRTQTPKANGPIDYGVMACSGDAGLAMAGPGNLCDKNGKPISFPGMGGRDAGGGGGTTPPTDAGTTDAGTTTTTPTDAGRPATGDAG
jgi:hypothetical protein